MAQSKKLILVAMETQRFAILGDNHISQLGITYHNAKKKGGIHLKYVLPLNKQINKFCK